MPTPDSARFVSVASFARLAGLSERTCWNLIREGQLPSFRVRRRRIVKVEEGLRAIERISGEASTTREPR